MRRLISIVLLALCARLATAGALPLTGKDIILMLRLGYSSDDILRDLNVKHFVGPLDSSSEAQIRQLNGSPTLLDDLRSGQFNATKDEVLGAEEKNAAVKADVEEQTREQPALQQPGTIGTHRTGGGRGGKAQGHPTGQQLIDLEVGQRLDLRRFHGPNIQVIFNGLDMSDVMITLVHPRRMPMVSGDNIPPGSNLSAAPGETSIRVKRENNSLVYRWGRMKLVYVDAADTVQNHVKLAIIPESNLSPTRM